MVTLFAALGFAVGIILAACGWPGWQIALAEPFAWLLTALCRALLDASYAGAAWLGCPVVERPGLVTVALHMAVLALFAHGCRPSKSGVPALC